MTEKQFLSELRKRDIYHYRSGDNIMFNCIFHGERTPSMGVNFKKGVFHCFSCEVTGNIAKLEKALFEGDIGIEEDFEEDETVEMLRLTARLEKRLKDVNIKSSRLMIRVLINSSFKDFSSVKRHTEYTHYLLGRKINPESWKKWDIRCGEWRGVKRILIPMYDEYKRLIAVYGRAISDDKVIRIRKTKDADVGKILFGLEHLKRKRKVVLVEGEIDAIYLQQCGVPAISLGTKRPTEIQLMKMAKYFSKVILSLDGDVPERTFKDKKGNKIVGVLEIVKNIREYVNTDVIKLPDKKDPNDLTNGEVSKIYEKLIK